MVDLEARCQRCTTLTRQMEGIFCANFGQPVLGLPLCHRAWCAACYRQRPGTSFLVYHGSDPETAPSLSEEKFYLQARAGDSTFCPFECDEHVFFRLTGSTSQHELIKRSLILFDVLTWTLFGLARPELSENSEECSTQTLNLVKHSDLLCFLTRLGLFPLNTMGGCALILAFYIVQIWLADMRQHRSMPQPERHDLYTLTFLWRALAEVQLLRQSDRDRGHRSIACAPTYSEWFSRFMTGLKSRIEERRRHDALISISLTVERDTTETGVGVVIGYTINEQGPSAGCCQTLIIPCTYILGKSSRF
jgi:hypothetical protein